VCQIRVAQDPKGDGVQAVADGAHQFGERIAIPSLRPSDEVCVHPTLLDDGPEGRLPSMRAAGP
jgi:hypothetical protein